MLRLTFLVLTGLICSCNQDNQSKSQTQQDNSKQSMTDTTQQEYKLSAKFNSFDTTVEVLFTDTKDSISELQKKNYDGFIAKQDLLTPEILKKVFDFYESSYADYKEGRGHLAAVPGFSNHQSGQALDLAVDAGDQRIVEDEIVVLRFSDRELLADELRLAARRAREDDRAEAHRLRR